MTGDEVPKWRQTLERTGLVPVFEDDSTYPGPDSAAALMGAKASVVNYYFPVEIEIVTTDGLNSLAETIYEALQREFSALG